MLTAGHGVTITSYVEYIGCYVESSIHYHAKIYMLQLACQIYFLITTVSMLSNFVANWFSLTIQLVVEWDRVILQYILICHLKYKFI